VQLQLIFSGVPRVEKQRIYVQTTLEGIDEYKIDEF
jgi:hypothetical protein